MSVIYVDGDLAFDVPVAREEMESPSMNDAVQRNATLPSRVGCCRSGWNEYGVGII